MLMELMEPMDEERPRCPMQEMSSLQLPAEPHLPTELHREEAPDGARVDWAEPNLDLDKRVEHSSKPDLGLIAGVHDERGLLLGGFSGVLGGEWFAGVDSLESGAGGSEGFRTSFRLRESSKLMVPVADSSS
mmetsp:Transcript_89701/g.155225  ORF Transcript_89701/g.155225 Transcript_89701/m.155225 type:complete len:132 (-) Transcript_89701:509-904(-)